MKKILKKLEFLRGLPENIVGVSNDIFSLLALLMAFAVVVRSGFMLLDTYEGFFTNDMGDILLDIGTFIILLKGYQILVHYYKAQYVSIKHVIELLIVALTIEAAFGVRGGDMWSVILFGIFALASLFIYLYFYNKLSKIEDRETKVETPE